MTLRWNPSLHRFENVRPVVRRVTTTTVVEGGGTTNTTVTQRVGLALTTRLTALLSTVKAGIGVSQGPTSLTIPQRVGLAVSARVDSAQVTNTQRPALRLTNRITKDPIVQKPAVNITQVVYNLVSTKGGDSVTEEAVSGRTDWASDNNATGLHDSAMATFAGDALGARGGRLRLGYANYVGKSELTISQVQVKFYGRVFSTVFNNADVQLGHIFGTTYTGLETITGDLDFRSTPRTHDITAVIAGDWANLDAISLYCAADAAITETWQAELDAIELVVTASKTDTI